MPQESFPRAPQLPPHEVPSHDVLSHDVLSHDVLSHDVLSHDVLSHDAPALTPHSDPAAIVPYLIGSTVEAIERELVLQTLTRCDGNRTHASRMLGVSVRTLRNKIRQYAAEGLDVAAHG